jgi:lycopene cyclase domain-containing protein
MSMVIVIGFQILVDGWLTKLSAPIVIYDEHHTSGVRFPFDIPNEDFLFGWAMVTSVLLLWVRLGARENRDEES